MKKNFFLLLALFLSFVLHAQEPKQVISVHDPVMMKQDSIYYLFSTGWGIAEWSSKDMKNWKPEKPIFNTAPAWAVKAVPGFKNHIWAPDISYHKGQYYLYYSVSAFGKNTSCIGLATNKTLNPDDPNYQWIDHGKVIQSVPGVNNWNAIDPNLITDKAGNPYLVFGSFWEGIKLVKLTKDRMHVAENLDHLPTLASRKKDASMKGNLPAVEGNPVDAGGNAIEGPFIFHKNGWYYLFASIDYCCRGPKSTYKMIVGRAKELKGPYLDKEGIALAHGGGSLLLSGDKHWYGVGHNAVCTFNGVDYLIFHGYDATDGGKSKLRIEILNWDKNDWPEVK